MANKTYNIELSDSELRNVTHGLQELHKRLMDNLQNVNVNTENSQHLKDYYKEKIAETFEQAKKYNALLTQM